MQTQTINETSPAPALLIKMVLDAWHAHNASFNKIFDSLTPEQLMQEVAPARNRGIYLVGHLLAVHDALLPLFGFGEKLYPHLEPVFLARPDKTEVDLPSADELKKYRDDINAALAQHMLPLQPADWFGRHSAVSEEAFAKEPHRNKLNVIINRTNHLSYHLGQLALLVK